MRLFTAFSVPDTVRESLVLETAPLRGAYPDLKWVGMNTFHITIDFLGEVEDRALKTICEAMETAGPMQEPFTMSYQGLGAFPGKGRPKVVFLKAERGIDECRTVQRGFAYGMKHQASEERKKFTPHITLARIRNSRSWPDVSREGRSVSAVFEVNRIILYSSHLKPSGAEYEELYSVKLGHQEE